ncbi:Cloacin immunity protein [Pseudomonas fluorescens]|uniref:Cloacin immunity family protein n=1 Tax=Pseudomonas tensinigenes TaxID=2745511 RepID=A0ABX8Q241_9PSED|nr:colicin E3-like toxin immunity protein [Pseudomonas tensinigenes]QXI07506.1 cloacin immunity family protein [Pseudomonas tensinigenes]VVM54925.1 Cloacin immunity protein [Pseudomonas fluorescens]VVN23613.1 Cloacin immunity protein [Pseudomonas fluorescens]VVN61972.1 Cloacin immunity protein [Pseudomonas fluorescens]
MGMRARLEWYDQQTELGEGEELSKDFGEDFSIIEALGLVPAKNINKGGFDVTSDWVEILQPNFQHLIQYSSYDYQVSFVYRNNW